MNSTKYTYEVSPVRFRRPDQDSDLVDVPCDECGVQVRLRVCSIRRTRQRRRRWLAVAAAGLLLAAVFGLDMIMGEPADSFWLRSPGLTLASACGTAIGLGAFIGGLMGWLVDEGVRVTSYAEHGRSHDFLPVKRVRNMP